MSEKRASPSASQNNNERDRFISPDNPTQEQQAKKHPPKKRRRKKGSKAELDALRSGDFGRQSRRAVFPQEKEDWWKLEGKKVLCEEIMSDKDDSSYSSHSSKDSEESLFDEGLGDHKLEQCVSNLEGNRILPIKKMMGGLRSSMTCRRCVIKNHKRLTKDFLAFCANYEEDIEREEATKLFRSWTDLLEWWLSRHKKVGELYQMFLAHETRNGSIPNKLCINVRVVEEA